MIDLLKAVMIGGGLALFAVLAIILIPIIIFAGYVVATVVGITLAIWIVIKVIKQDQEAEQAPHK